VVDPVTARALGLAVRPLILARVDEAIGWSAGALSWSAQRLRRPLSALDRTTIQGSYQGIKLPPKA
jgi:hypothetical protein